MNVVNLSQEQALSVNTLKKVIAYYQSKNSDGRYTKAIEKDTALLRSFMNDIIERPEAAPMVEAA